METNERTEDDESKTTVIIPTELLDDFKHLAIDMKTTVSTLIVQSMQQYLKDTKKKWAYELANYNLWNNSIRDLNVLKKYHFFIRRGLAS